MLAEIDQHRKTFNTDYIDSLLVHCMTAGEWTDKWKRVMDAFNEAKEKKWIRAKGFPATPCPRSRRWSRPTGPRSIWCASTRRANSPTTWRMPDESGHDIAPVMEQIKIMHQKGRGVIGMKLIGNGMFKDPADREKSIRFAMACQDIDAVVIGVTSTQEIDEAIERINRALKEV